MDTKIGGIEMLRIHLRTGLAWTKSIDVDGEIGDDLLALVDGYYSDNGDLPVKLYSFNELLEIHTNEDFSIDENGLSISLDEMLPINGGEFYIDGIEYIEII